MEVGSATALIDALAELGDAGEVELRLALSPDEPVEDIVPAFAPSNDAWPEPHPDDSALLRAAASAVILAGPGVIECGAVTGLHDLAVSAGLGVLNTWGAKGVFHWRSQHHLATVGLQADDFILGGLADVDLVISSGLNQSESPDWRWQLGPPTLRIEPAALASFAEQSGPRRSAPAMPVLRARLADVTQRGWSSPEVPIPPSRITLHYAERLAEGALIAADAGTAGYWVARTLGTSRLGAVIVPSTNWPGHAAACIAVALLRRPSQPALAVIDGPADEATMTILEAAATLGVHVPVEAWDPAGERLDATSHRDRLRTLVLGGTPQTAGPSTLATDPDQLAQMIDAAGAIVAWS
jgi:thiamine pyrophosphate-dependent acetolactate synthase large subunit-like protein